MRKRHTDSWQTVPHTTQELRYSCKLDRDNEDSDHSKYIRGKRRRKTLPNSYDDKRCGSWDLRKSWKEKRGKQYYGRKQLKEFKIESTGTRCSTWFSSYWCLFLEKEQKYLEEMNIPHKISREYKIEVEVRTTKWTFVKDGKTKPVYHWKAKPDGTYPVFYWIETGEWKYVPCKPYEVHHKTLTKETITYWNNKELIFNY
jgi:hypothetical protein